VSQRPSAYFFAGGLDTNSSPLHASPGTVINSLNYEPLVEGYGRCEGYERFDGRPSPSEATFFSIQFVNGSIAVAAGDTIVGQTSDATGVAVAVAALDSGSFDDGDAAGTFAVINIDGEFEAGKRFGSTTQPPARSSMTPPSAMRLRQNCAPHGCALRRMHVEP
jgi:hypothetical protein